MPEFSYSLNEKNEEKGDLFCAEIKLLHNTTLSSQPVQLSSNDQSSFSWGINNALVGDTRYPVSPSHRRGKDSWLACDGLPEACVPQLDTAGRFEYFCGRCTCVYRGSWRRKDTSPPMWYSRRWKGIIFGGVPVPLVLICSNAQLSRQFFSVYSSVFCVVFNSCTFLIMNRSRSLVSSMCGG